MICKLLKRCVLAGLLVAMLAMGALAGCYLLACSPPTFYAVALEKPVDAADVETAIAEIEQRVASMQLFVHLDAAGRKQLQALPRQTLATTDLGRTKAKVNLADALQNLEHASGEKHDTYVLSLTERHLNAALNQEAGAKGNELSRPHISLQNDIIRFAVTLDTPAVEVALSCDFELSKTSQTEVTFELRGLSVGRLPLPTKAILTQIMKMQPTLPTGCRLNLEGEYPTITFAPLRGQGKLQVDRLHVADGLLHLTFRRTADDTVAATN